MPIPHPGMELETLIAKFLLQGCNKLAGLFTPYMPCGKILHVDIAVVWGECNKIHPEGHIVRAKLYTHAYSFKRRTACIACAGVVSEYREVCNITARWKPFRHCMHQPHLTGTGQSVHIGCLCRLKGGLAIKFRAGLIGHAVAQKYDYLHILPFRTDQLVADINPARASLSIRAEYAERKSPVPGRCQWQTRKNLP